MHLMPARQVPARLGHAPRDMFESLLQFRAQLLSKYKYSVLFIIYESTFHVNLISAGALQLTILTK